MVIEKNHFFFFLPVTIKKKMLKKPTIFIFGWLGAKDFNLNKISCFYKNAGFETESIIQSPTSLLNIKRDKSLDEFYKKAIGKPIVCHLFSLNGASAFYKSFTSNNLIIKPNLNIKGFIMDCTPGHVERALYHRAFSNALFPNSPQLKSAMSGLLTPLFQLFLWCARSHRKESARMLRSLYNNPLQYPTLAITSKKDDLIPYQDVLEYVNNLKKTATPVQDCVFYDTTHVKAYHDHTKFYKNMVTNFAKLCFENPYGIKTKHIIE